MRLAFDPIANAPCDVVVEVEKSSIEGIMLLNTYSNGNPIVFAQLKLGLSLRPYSIVYSLGDLEMMPNKKFEEGFDRLAHELKGKGANFHYDYEEKIFDIDINVV